MFYIVDEYISHSVGNQLSGSSYADDIKKSWTLSIM